MKHFSFFYSLVSFSFLLLFNINKIFIYWGNLEYGATTSFLKEKNIEKIYL